MLKAHSDPLEQVEVTCLIALEVGTPAGAAPVVWRLLSNRSATTLEQALEHWQMCVNKSPTTSTSRNCARSGLSWALSTKN